MEQFWNDILLQIELLFEGDFNLLHYITFIFSFCFLIYGISKLKERAVKGVFVIITTIFYLITFSITANGYATVTSFLMFSAIAVILNFIIWIAVSHIKIRFCFGWLFGYLLIIIPAIIVGLLMEILGITEEIVFQFSFLFIAFLLTFLPPYFINSSGSGGSSSGNPFEKLGPGWGSVFRDWP